MSAVMGSFRRRMALGLASLVVFLLLFAGLDHFRMAFCLQPYGGWAGQAASTCRWVWAQGPYAVVLAALCLLLILAAALMAVAMVVLRLTHGMPFKAWADTPQFFRWSRFIAGRGPDPRAPPGPLTYEQMLPMIRQAAATVAAQARSRLVAASQHTDEEFFRAIMALPDESFRLVASKVGPISEFDQERGMRWTISPPEKAHRLQAELEPLRQMGLVYWMDNEDALSFDHTVIGKRLALRADLVAELAAEAERRGLRLLR